MNARSCPTLCDPMDYTVHGILQARTLEWVPFLSPADLRNPRIELRSPTLQADSLPAEPQGKPFNEVDYLKYSRFNYEYSVSEFRILLSS